MKKNLIIILISVVLCGCGAPKNFSYRYGGENTGLDKRININGYYVSQHSCDSAFYSMYMFYPDGLFTIATTSRISAELIDCFENGGKNGICKYPLWGTYIIEGNLIKTQVIRPEGNGCVIFRDYRIFHDKSIVNVSDYVQPEYTNLGYMENYPSFTTNPCEIPAKFYPTANKRSTEDCPLLKKGWFRKKNK